MTKCEAYKDTREPDCENKAEYVYFPEAGRKINPIRLCEFHLDMALEGHYERIKGSS